MRLEAHTPEQSSDGERHSFQKLNAENPTRKNNERPTEHNEVGSGKRNTRLKLLRLLKGGM